MFKRTVSLTLLVVVTVASMVLVVVAVQTPPRRDGGDASRSESVRQNVTAAADRPAGPAFAAESQGIGLADIQAKIGASDEEWKVIGPKLGRVLAAYAAIEASIDESNTDGSGFMPWGPGGRGGPGPDGGPRGGPGNDSFAGPGDSGPFGRGGPGPGGFGRGGPRPDGFGPDGPGPDGFGRGGPGPDGFGPGGPGPDGFGPGGFGRGGRGPGGLGRGGPGPGGGPPGFGGFPGFGGMAIMQRLMELRTTLADPNATLEQVKEKMTAVRDARQKARVELAAARSDLLQLLTLDQEAMLVRLDCLD